jgi:predicted TIM-barrel fold metal-dependent hydrolase
MIATAYPSVNFILPHLGAYRSWQWWAHYEAIDLVKRFPNVYVGTSSVISRKYLEMAARELPPERILFGSFAPELDPRVEIFSLKLLKLPKPSEALVLGGNIQRLLGQ